MANKNTAGYVFSDTPLNLTEAERSALVAYVREAIDREHNSTGPSRLARLKRLKRLLTRLDWTEKPRARDAW